MNSKHKIKGTIFFSHVKNSGVAYKVYTKTEKKDRKRKLLKKLPLKNDEKLWKGKDWRELIDCKMKGGKKMKELDNSNNKENERDKNWREKKLEIERLLN